MNRKTKPNQIVLRLVFCLSFSGNLIADDLKLSSSYGLSIDSSLKGIKALAVKNAARLDSTEDTANSAKTTANSAKSIANTAKSIANTATTKANSAYNQANTNKADITSLNTFTNAGSIKRKGSIGKVNSKSWKTLLSAKTKYSGTIKACVLGKTSRHKKYNTIYFQIQSNGVIKSSISGTDTVSSCETISVQRGKPYKLDLLRQEIIIIMLDSIQLV